MSIISDALKGKITWATAAEEIGVWFGQVGKRVMSDPVLAQAANDLNTAVKQAASNALALADSELGAHYAEATSAVEAAADGLLLKITGGAALPAIPLVNGGIKQGLDTLRAAIDAKELEWQAKLQPAPAPAAPPQ